jgi:hypothetical protein
MSFQIGGGGGGGGEWSSNKYARTRCLCAAGSSPAPPTMWISILSAVRLHAGRRCVRTVLSDMLLKTDGTDDEGDLLMYVNR